MRLKKSNGPKLIGHKDRGESFSRIGKHHGR
jgi:hypothetical protein